MPATRRPRSAAASGYLYRRPVSARGGPESRSGPRRPAPLRPRSATAGRPPRRRAEGAMRQRRGGAARTAARAGPLARGTSMGAMSEPRDDTRSVSELLLAGIEWASLGVEAAKRSPTTSHTSRWCRTRRDARCRAGHDRHPGAPSSNGSATGATRRSSVRSPARGSHGARRSKTSLSASRGSSTGCGCSSATASPDRATDRVEERGQHTLRRDEIGRVATRHGFGYLLDRRRATGGEPDADRGRRLREMFDELGPTFVKFGQLLSTRPDVVPRHHRRAAQAPGRGLAFLDRGRRAGRPHGARPDDRGAGVPRVR